jgi:hypothetical protein
MALLVVRRGPAAAATKERNTLPDWDSFLHSLWLQKMAVDPDLYFDAKISHSIGTCPCKCTGNLYLREGHRKK